MLLLEGHISNFTCAGYYFIYVEFSDFYVNQSLAGQTILLFRITGIAVGVANSNLRWQQDPC
jgi:hypothetical protein